MSLALPRYGMSFQTYHGDCAAIIPTLTAIDAVVSDPPYGCSNDCDYSRLKCKGGKGNEYKPVMNDDKPFDPTHLLSVAPKIALFGFNNFSNKLPKGSLLVWVKKLPNTYGKFMSDAEVAWMNKGCGTYLFHHLWQGVLKDSEKGQRALHPTQKPVEVMKWVIGVENRGTFGHGIGIYRFGLFGTAAELCWHRD